MGRIKLLDNLTIQKIAAGEVIERPASIVKELVENSIDANSKNIIIEINNGGKSYIRVTDDGDGIDEDDIPLAFERHSTSKLNEIDDLYSLLTLGFRGEALSSISAVSKVEILTKTNNSTAGVHAIIENGKIISLDRVGTPKGTTMIVKDLFYNLPVRKKFLKSDLYEGNNISDIVYKLALGNYNISFKFIKDNKVILKTNCKGDIIENIYTILGKDITKGLIPIDFQSEDLSIKGYISNNNLYRSNRSHQYIYINGRFIVNYSISNAIEQHYKSLIPLNRFPVFIIYIDMNPADLDVNIHPTKQEVKFTASNNITELIGNIIHEKLYPSLNIPKFDIKTEDIKKEIPILYNNKSNDGIVVRDYTDISINDESDKYLEHTDSVSDNNNEKSNLLSDNNKLDYVESISSKKITSNYMSNFLNESESIEDFLNLDDNTNIKETLPEINPIGVVFGTYIMGENRELDKLYFIDQHAAHERVLYEKYKTDYENESINIQQLITPEVIDLTMSEYSLYSHNVEYFYKLGFEVEEFGPSSVAIRGVPFLFGRPNIKNLFLDLLDNIGKNLKSSYDTRLDKLMKLACSSAIKGGDRLSELEIKSLLKDLSNCTNPYSCPHGRPTVIEITKKDIEKQFLRIV
jgi:DNA mismatch repair protein MutL